MQSQREMARPDALSGRLLDGRYRLGERIARGGMASVYQATDTRLDRLVAVKIMHPGLGDEDDFAAKFVREARSAARLSHPNIVAVHDQGEDGGLVFLAMEYVPGDTLRTLISQEAPLRPARALALFEPVVSALAAAHRAGLIHRDIKPENVLVSPDQSKIKVADFGLAKAVSADTMHTVTGGVLIGTVSYLAPELVTDGKADGRADVYALGVLLYELLTGKKPHEGETPIAIAYKHVHADVPAPSVLAPGIPAYVDALVARATSRDLAQRPADAGVLLHLVRRVAQALKDGVDDEDLTADLRPRTTPTEFDEAPRPGDTAPFGAPLGAFFHDSGMVADADADADTDTDTDTDTDPGGTEEPVADHDVPTDHREVATYDNSERAPGLTRVDRRPSNSGAVVLREHQRSRKGPVALLLALLLVSGAAGAAYWWLEARYTTTPGVLGLTAAQAGSKLAKAGLDAKEGTPAYSETVAAGQVLRSVPEPGAKVLDHGTVTLVLSLGQERYDVPKLAGMTEDQAQDALAASHLSFGRSTKKWNGQVPVGQVISSSPAAGETLRPETAVNLVLSKGPKPIPVRDWTGKSAAQATKALEGKGLVVTRADDVYSDSVDAGDVVSQTPTDGTLVKGDEVRLTVSKGPELVTIPDGLKGAGVAAATAELEALGFEVDVENSSVYLGLGYVFSLTPGEGERVAKGSTITLYLV